MTFYVYVDGESQTYPLTLTDLRRMRPDVSFPVQISDEDAASFSFYPVAPAPQPSEQFQTIERTAVLVDGEWLEEWIVTPWTDEQIAAATEAQWDVIRGERNAKLAASDWTQLPDCPLDNTAQTDWAIYRQALRDITNQADPFNIVWPVAPGA